MGTEDPYAYIDDDLPSGEILSLLGELPKRWGRMDQVSRLAVVETGRVLQETGILMFENGAAATRGRGGLVGVTSRGSLATDLDYAESLKQGPEMASPILFGYTLPNTALAEAASHYGLTGPVYSLFSEEGKVDGRAEAKRWLGDDPGLDFMVVGRLDVFPDPAGKEAKTVIAKFIIVS